MGWEIVHLLRRSRQIPARLREGCLSGRNWRTVGARQRSRRKFAATRNSFERYQQAVREETNIWRTALRFNRGVRRQLDLHYRLQPHSAGLDWPQQFHFGEPRFRSLSIYPDEPGPLGARRPPGAGNYDEPKPQRSAGPFARRKRL